MIEWDLIMTMTVASGTFDAVFAGGGSTAESKAAKRLISEGRLTVVREGADPINIKSVAHKMLCEAHDHDLLWWGFDFRLKQKE